MVDIAEEKWKGGISELNYFGNYYQLQFFLEMLILEESSFDDIICIYNEFEFLYKYSLKIR